MWGMHRSGGTDDRAAADGALASLAGHALANRFCAWRGASDRRYIASVYHIDLEAPDAGLPHFDGCLLIAVIRSSDGRHVLSVNAIERGGDRLAAIARGRAAGVDEWHVHFLAGTPAERAAAAADLTGRHLAALHLDAA